MTMTVKSFATEQNLWGRIEDAVKQRLEEKVVDALLQRLAGVPIKSSRASRTLGAYVFKTGEPVCIRLQFAQSIESLQQTFLHEVAHVCDHLSYQPKKIQRRDHGSDWQIWAVALGIPPVRCGESAELAQLHRTRLKPVAVCQKCGFVLRRIRRLNRRGDYIHSPCGGRLKTL
ncbi:MAG: SprT-like domain-containing protein [Desulfuromonadales bacterium]|nr:SprT-like domain-containing protein [Desulfuromonadales bacterium]